MNRLILAALIAVNLWQFLVIPLLSSWWALTVIPLALLNNTTWSLIHEAIHGNLAASPAENRWGGRILSALFGSSFHFLCAGHLSHHALNRTVERLEVVEAGESLWKARVQYYLMLCGGLYVLEVLVPLAFIVPVAKLRSLMPDTSARSMVRMVFERAAARHWSVLWESLASISLLAFSAYLYGAHWPVLLGIVAARAFFVSSLDYIYHYGNQLDDVNASYNLALPSALSRFLLHFNWHHTHHLSPRTPWYELPIESIKRYQRYDQTYWRAAIRAWRGPVRRDSSV